MNEFFQVTAFENPEHLAAATASLWLKLLSASPREKPFTVALSGGRIARSLFAAMAMQAREYRGSWSQAHFFWADERCVPPTDPESNYPLAQQCLFQPLGLPETQIHRIPGEKTPPYAAMAAEAALRRVTGAPVNTMPQLDLVFLGMGEDGHIASLFPDTPAQVLEQWVAYCPVIGPKPPPHRITLTYHALTTARHVWVLVTGPGKATALRESLIPEGRTPLGRLLQQRCPAFDGGRIPAGPETWDDLLARLQVNPSGGTTLVNCVDENAGGCPAGAGR